MKTATTFLLSLASVAVWADATVTSATLSQNWPWSLEMTLKYTVAGVTSPVSVSTGQKPATKTPSVLIWMPTAWPPTMSSWA